MENFEQIDRISKTQLSYYRILPFDPTEEDYRAWLEDLDGAFKKGMEAKGFDSCKTILPFQRFYFEYRYGHDMTTFLKNNLSDEDYSYYVSISENRKSDQSV